jgi:hypothetical protein
VSVLLGNGDGSFHTAASYTVHATLGRLPPSLTVADLNGDGRLDLVTADSADNSVSVMLGNGDGSFQEAHDSAVASFPISVAVGDFNADGKPDLATANANNNTVGVLLGNGDGTFQTAQSFAVGLAPRAVVVADFNGDGKLDLATANANSDDVSLLLGNGDGTFQTAGYSGVSFGSHPFAMAVADFNGDGKPDVATANLLDNSVSLLVGVGSGLNGIGYPGSASFAVGSFPISIAVGDFDGNGKPDLAVANRSSGTLSILLNQAQTTTTLSPPSLTYGQPTTLTATVTSDAGPVTAGTVTFFQGYTPAPLNAAGQATVSVATVPPGNYVASYSGAAGFLSSPSNVIRVNPAPLSATAVNVKATAGAPFSGAVATFTNADPLGSAASYTATIGWGDGSTSTGTITGSGTLTVGGSHTYADTGSYTLNVQISHNLGYTTTATVSPTATVTGLGLSVQRGLAGDIGFWHGSSGQALINSFNGGPGATALSTWLAQNFSNLYGNLWGWTNADVAAFYQSQFALSGPNAEAQVLATALNVYATTRSLGGTAGQAYGFTLTDAGLGAYSFNAGSDGAAFGMADNSSHTVYAFLKAVDWETWSIFSSDSLRKQVNDLFDALDKAGRI